MTDTDLAWLAGLLEGEGCFALDTTASRRPGHRRNAILVKLKMTDKDVVERARKIMLEIHSFNNIVCKLTERPPRKDIYVVKINAHAAEAIMRAVRPYMGMRRGAKIDELLAMKNLSHHPREKAA